MNAWSLPPIPAQDAMHPLVVHFPIALLVIVPLLLLAAILAGKHWRALAVAALIVMLAGVISAFAAVSTGEAAEEQAEAVPAAHDVFEEHEHLAEDVRNYYFVLGIALIVVLGIGFKVSDKVGKTLLGLFLIAHAGGLPMLANTAHLGGRLVHEFGVRSPLGGATPNVVIQGDDDSRGRGRGRGAESDKD
jgi:uncharacterized membrane protein